MRMTFDAQLHQLNDELVAMGGLCEEAITSALRALTEGDTGAIDATLATDARIDQAERDIEALCLKLLLRQQPVARDLRQISSALKMISDMERIGDQAADVTEILRFWDSGVFAGGTHIDKMAQAASKMVTDAIDSFVRRDDELAQSVIAADDRVDELFVRVRQELIELIARQDQNGVACMDLLMIAKYFEHIADHAENIARWVLYRLHGTLPERDDVRGGR